MVGSKPLRSKGWRSSAGCRSRLRPLRRAELRPERKRDRGDAMMRSTLAVTCVGLAVLAGCDGAGERYDLVIENGRVVDGTGAPWFYGDVAVRGDRIARIAPAGMLANAPAAARLDARGRVVSPGFIDIISHSRGALLDGDGRVVGKVTQGITTEIM